MYFLTPALISNPEPVHSSMGFMKILTFFCTFLNVGSSCNFYYKRTPSVQWDPVLLEATGSDGEPCFAKCADTPECIAVAIEQVHGVNVRCRAMGRDVSGPFQVCLPY